MENILYQILITIFIIFSAILSGAETSLISANSIKIRSLSDKGIRRARKSIYMLDNIKDSLSMILIGKNLANVAATAFIVFIAARSFMLSEMDIFIVTCIQTVFFLVFCEILPRTVARSKADSYLMLFSYPMFFLMVIFKPFVRLSLLFSIKLKDIFNLDTSEYSIIGCRDEIGTLFKPGEEEGIIDEDHHAFVSEILDFHDVSASEVMTPTIDIISIEKKQDIKILVKLIEDTRFSRIPVYADRVDNIIGFIHYRDILKNMKIKKADEIVKKPYFVPSTKRIYELFLEMQEKQLSIVFVVNEFGAVEGLITYEDIAEEIVGEIQTRDHPDEILIKKVNDYKYILDGSLDIEFFQREFDFLIEKKGFETIAGFITHRLGKIPKKGEGFVLDGKSFTVHEATDRSVEKVIFEKSKGTREKK